MENANLLGAYLGEAILYETNLKRTYLRKTNLEKADSKEAILKGANLEEANLLDVRNLSADQLLEVSSPYNARLNPGQENALKQEAPHLFENPES